MTEALEYFPTQDEVEASVERSIELLGPYEKKLHSILSRASSVPEHRYCGKPVQFKMLRGLCSELDSIMGKVVPCHNGCSHCCNMATSVSQTEADLISQQYGIQPAYVSLTSIFERPRSEYVAQYNNVPCTFLVKGSCSIYEYRPLSCRTNYNVTEYPSLCDMGSHPNAEVPTLNLTPIWKAAAACSIGEPMGDIREFFPNGLEKAAK